MKVKLHRSSNVQKFLNLNLKPRDFFISAIIFSILTAALFWVIDLEKQRNRQEIQYLTNQHSISLLSNITAELNANVFLVNGLVAFLNADPDFTEEEIYIALETLYNYGHHLNNVGVAPDNRLQYIYPLEGNEAAIGLNYEDNPEQWPGVKAAIEAKSTRLDGPINLIQGGTGLISRTPVFLKDDVYWGILSLVLDTDSLLANTGLGSDEFFRIALRHKDETGNLDNTFVGDSAMFDSDAIFMDVPIPGGKWELATMPAEGWNQGDAKLDLLLATGMLMSAILSMGTLLIRSKQLYIESTEKTIRTILDTIEEGVLVFSQNGNIFSVNPAACQMLEYSQEEIHGLPVNKLIKAVPQSSSGSSFSEQVMNGSRIFRNAEHQELTAICQNGRKFPIECCVGKNIDGSRIFHVVSFRDITTRKLAEDSLRMLATTDGLTGIHNRRTGIELGQNALASALRYNNPIAVIMLDADNFKKVNDRFGHYAGDQVLVHLVKIMKSQLRKSDILCRYGGEEFVVLLPETSLAKARVLATRVLEAVRNTSVKIKEDMEIYFTVSIGISDNSKHSDDLNVIINKADEAMYTAKENGRDRLEIYSEDNMDTILHMPLRQVSEKREQKNS